MISISVLLTCHNRRLKTERSLKSLKTALEVFNRKQADVSQSSKVCIEIYLTDDGCTDGTSEASRAIFPDFNKLHILKGNGNLYWAGGMRFCWNEARKRHEEWDYYLLLNDDTELMSNVFEELFNSERYAIDHFGLEGIVSGITCEKYKENKMSYGGSVWVNKFFGKKKRLSPIGTPQLCDMTNANILLVPKNVVNMIGIFHNKYIHCCADYDYSHFTRKAGLPVLVTANFCGYCENDHKDYDEITRRIMAMTLKERKEYFNNPIHSSSDYLHFISRVSPIRYPLVWFGRILNLYCPALYYRLNTIRNK